MDKEVKYPLKHYFRYKGKKYKTFKQLRKASEQYDSGIAYFGNRKIYIHAKN